jgi:hypothetical protein
MRTQRRRTGPVPSHRAPVRAWWVDALARHRWYAALGAVTGTVALASGVMLWPSQSRPPEAGGCGPAACTARRPAPAAAAAESGASLRSATQPPARARETPAQPGGRARATPSLPPRQPASNNGHGKGLTHRHRWHRGSTG